MGLPKSIVHEIVMTKFQIRKVCAKLVPKVLTDEQKENRVSISRELLDRVRGNPDYLEQVVTGDETWVFSTIRRRKDRALSGTLPILFDQRRLERANQR